MPKYHFKSQSLIDDISFFQNESGTSRAYLHARDGVGDDQLAGILTLLRHHDYDCVPYDMDGKPVLEVRNYGAPKKLLSVLKREHIISGEPAIERLDGDVVSLKDKLGKRTLQLSGLSYVIGDFAYYKYSKLEGLKEGQLASYFYALGTYALLGLGRNDQSEFQVRDMAQAFERFLDKKGDVIPNDCSLHAIAHEHDQHPLLKIHDFLKRHPSEVFNTFTGLAGAMIAVNAYKNQYAKAYPSHYSAKDVKDLRMEGLMDMGLGLGTLASTTYGTLAKEKKPDPDEPQPTNPLGKAISHLKHKPLSVTALGLMASTAFHAASTYKAYKTASHMGDAQRLKSIPWRGAFVALNIMSEILISVSSKGHGDGVTSDDTVHQTAYKMAAEVILNQPQEQRETMTNYIADFLQAPDVLAENHEEVVKKLNAQIETLKDNPWLCTSAKPMVDEGVNTQKHEHVVMPGEVPTPHLAEKWSKTSAISPHIAQPGVSAPTS